MELVWNHQTVYLLLHFQFESSVPSQTTSNNGFSIILTRSSTESNIESTLKNRYKVVFAFFERILKIYNLQLWIIMPFFKKYHNIIINNIPCSICTIVIYTPRHVLISIQINIKIRIIFIIF